MALHDPALRSLYDLKVCHCHFANGRMSYMLLDIREMRFRPYASEAHTERHQGTGQEH